MEEFRPFATGRGSPAVSGNPSHLRTLDHCTHDDSNSTDLVTFNQELTFNQEFTFNHELTISQELINVECDSLLAYVPANVISIGPCFCYKYTNDLLSFDACRPAEAGLGPALPPICRQITTPLDAEVWACQLRNHPDRAFADYIVSGIRQGFRLGFDYSKRKPLPAKKNMRSATDNGTVVEEYLRKEVSAGRVIAGVQQAVQVSRFGAIPKAGEPNSWRLIVDLSYPHGRSVNDSISKELSSIRYATVDQAVQCILDRGPGTELAKIDVEQAYRNVPVHEDDRWLLGMEWDATTYMDMTLPFGLRSAPKIFSALADALEWAFLEAGVSFSMHLLDDFLTMGKGGTGECGRNLDLMKGTCNCNGTPLKVRKTVGPSTVIEFLGIILDTIRMEMRLSEEKIRALKVLLQVWSCKRACTKRELLSLIGKLGHACKIVRPGRIFLRRMIKASTRAKQLDHWVRLDDQFRSDLAWWVEFLEVWNGKGFMWGVGSRLHPDVRFASDASGTWGCGAVWGKEWLQGRWGDDWSELNITIKELLPIVLGCAVWGPQWRRKLVLNLCDNMAVVQVCKSHKSKEPVVMHLLRCLHFICAHWEIELRVEHIPGRLNVQADAVSRNYLQVMEAEGLVGNPRPIPDKLWRLLVVERPDWQHPTWKSLLTASLREVLLQAPAGRTQ